MKQIKYENCRMFDDGAPIIQVSAGFYIMCTS